MRIIITGTPGTGKTAIAKALGKKIRHKVVNEKEFCTRRGIGKYDRKLGERIIPITKLARELNKFLAGHEKTILEGHLLCEAKLKADTAIVLTLPPKELEKRLRKRNYSEVKIQENIWCEETQYCKKKALKNYGKKKLVIVKGEKSPAKTVNKIIKIIGGK
ncbi:MAG: AAA family ATPase [Candidatus Diapherotrites archaeon]|nr:AAA family ATPase [Candidatus Diapherotrites archaeon]